MTSEHEKARDIYIEIQSLPTAKTIRQDILLNLALCYEALNDSVPAVATAKECVSLDPKSNRALQAKTIVVGMNKQDPERDKKLRKIEAEARKKKAFVVASNVALARSVECADPAETKSIVEMVANGSATNDDHHNKMRAIIRLAEITLDEGRNLTRTDLTRVIDAYHYLYSESFSVLFNSCHNVLWRAFEKTGETANLLRLFRHSSLIWRLRDEPSLEQKFLAGLGNLFGGRTRVGIRDADREMAYFLARAGYVMNKAKALE